jgi:hypothetical protein
VVWTQLPALPHPLRVLLRAVELRECGITAAPRFSLYFSWVGLKLPNEPLKPRMGDAQFPGPSTTGRFVAVAAGEPLEDEPPD